MGQISDLPDDILASIVSQLPIMEAVSTSILSSRWRFLWTRCTHLNFDFEKTFTSISVNRELPQTERQKFVKWVDHVLELNEASTIYEFKVCFSLDKRFKVDVDEWIKFALSRKVQRLELDLPIYVYLQRKKAYTFPFELFAQAEETCLSSRFGITGNSILVGVKSLREVCLKNIYVADEVVEFLLFNCPVLERLSIETSFSLVNLTVGGPRCALKYLEIDFCPNIKSIKISGSNLVSFHYYGQKTNLLLENVSSLVDVCFGYDVAVSFLDGSMNDSFSQLSCYLKTLTVQLWSYGVTEQPHLLPKLTALEQLTVEITGGFDYSVLTYTNLIQVSPHLQKFVLKVHWDNDLSISSRKVERYPSCPHQCLKEVKLAGYYGRKCELEVAIYFLENAVALEKMIISPRDGSEEVWRCRSTRRQRAARSRAKQQLEGIVPAGVKLVIL